MEKINIVCASDNGYISHCGALIVSIFENNKSNKICVYVLTEDINFQNRKLLLKCASDYNQEIEFVDIPVGIFNSYPMEVQSLGYINYSTYYRLLIPELLPNLDKVIYLDCDMLVLADLSLLWDLNIEQYAIAGVKDALNNQVAAPARLGYDSHYSYFNAGMGVWNLYFLRRINFSEKVKDYVRKNYEKIQFHDQDILNAILFGFFLEVGMEWNLMGAFLRGKDFVIHSKELECIKTPKIIHFADVLKPWFKECDNPYKGLYWYYLGLTPWANDKASYKYKLAKRILLYIKRYLKHILSLLGFRRYIQFNFNQN